jgi:putative membrane protein
MHAGVTTTGWAAEPAIVGPVALVAIIYARGAWRLRRRRRDDARWFGAGWVALAVALVSPLHGASERLFSAHMAQHELLMVVAAPLLVLGRPSVALLWALPHRARPIAGRLARVKMRPLATWLIHGIVIWVWHLPALFEATITSDAMHALQHASFLGSALLFWAAIIRPRRRASLGMSLVYLFTTTVHTGVLGALMAFSRTPWYPAYAASTSLWGLSPIEDQQLAGLIMWIPASAAYLLAALLILRRWLHSSEMGAAADQPVQAAA